MLGSNIALAVIATSALPAGASAATTISAQEIVIEAPQAPLTTNFMGARYPVAEIKITQGFRAFHPGIDLDGRTGDPVKPVKSGVVETVQYSRFQYGNAIYVNHGDGVVSLYAHLSKVMVKEGDQVSPDQVIGLMGSTGRSTGDHLHLEIRVNGKAVNPVTVIGQN